MGRSRDDFGTKIHLPTDGTGLPLVFCLSGGQAHKSQYAEMLLNRVGVIRKSGHLKSRPKAVLADKGYSGKNLRYCLKKRGIKAVIPFKSNEKTSRDGRRKLDTEYDDLQKRSCKLTIEITLDYLVDHLANTMHADKKIRAAFNRDIGYKVLFVKDVNLMSFGS
ncbi:hypothetical protein E05_51730 (plasmid) [Plautia stali symbiont]|nr:hypothetical protein E05_51730 [Plautia stali symbiont]